MRSYSVKQTPYIPTDWQSTNPVSGQTSKVPPAHTGIIQNTTRSRSQPISTQAAELSPESAEPSKKSISPA